VIGATAWLLMSAVPAAPIGLGVVALARSNARLALRLAWVAGGLALAIPGVVCLALLDVIVARPGAETASRATMLAQVISELCNASVIVVLELLLACVLAIVARRSLRRAAG